MVEEYIHLDAWRVVGVARPNATSGMSSPDLFPVLSDHLGTPRKVLDGATGQSVWAWDAKEPFGHELPNNNPSGLGAFTFNLRFPGQVFDEETGLFHNGYRDYHSKLGRYVQSDPLGLEAGWNTYAYVGGDPLGAIDPLGLFELADYIYPFNMHVFYQNEAQKELKNFEYDHLKVDAYRHCLASCDTTRTWGRFPSYIAGGANELLGMCTGQPSNEMEMDLYNNKLGRDLGWNQSSYTQCKKTCMGSVKGGITINYPR